MITRIDPPLPVVRPTPKGSLMDALAPSTIVVAMEQLDDRFRRGGLDGQLSAKRGQPGYGLGARGDGSAVDSGQVFGGVASRLLDHGGPRGG